MKIIILLLTIALVSCNKEESKTNIDSEKVKQLKAQNDSLKRVNRDLQTKLNDDSKTNNNITDTLDTRLTLEKGVNTEKDLQKILKGKTLNQVITIIGKPDNLMKYSPENSAWKYPVLDCVWWNFSKETITGKTDDLEIYFHDNGNFVKFGSE